MWLIGDVEEGSVSAGGWESVGREVMRGTEEGGGEAGKTPRFGGCV